MRYQSYYRPSYNFSNKISASRAKQPTETWSADTVWAAAAYAQRINGSYLKEDVVQYIDESPVVVNRSSKALMRSALADQSLISQEDITVGQDARDWHKKNLLVKALKTPLNDFEQSVAKVSNQDEFNDTQRLELAVTASQIQSFIVNRRLAEANSRIDRSAGFLGEVGAKIGCDLEVIRCTFSERYGCFFVSGITSANQAVFFSYRSKLNPGVTIKVVGTVKAHRDDSTQLTRTKIVA